MKIFGGEGCDNEGDSLRSITLFADLSGLCGHFQSRQCFFGPPCKQAMALETRKLCLLPAPPKARPRHSDDQHCWKQYRKVRGGPNHLCKGCRCYGEVIRKKWLCVHCWAKNCLLWESLPCRACIAEYDLQIGPLVHQRHNPSNDNGNRDAPGRHRRGLKRRREDSRDSDSSSSSFSEHTTHKLEKFLERRIGPRLRLS